MTNSFALTLEVARSGQMQKGIFIAIIREMVELGNNTAAAYAMQRTHMYFNDSELKKNDSPPAKKLREAKAAYERMTYQETAAWSRSVIRRYPRLEQFVRGCR